MEIKFSVGDREKHEIVYMKDPLSGADQVWVDGTLYKKRVLCLSTKFKFTVGVTEKHDVVIHFGLKEFLASLPKVVVDGVPVTEIHAMDTRKNKPFESLWTPIASQKNAETAVLSGVLAGWLSIGMTTLIAVLPIFGIFIVKGIDATIFIDILIMTVLVVGLTAKSRISACALIFYYILGKLSLFASNPDSIAGSLFLSVLFLLMFINGARGAFGYWKYSEKKTKRFSWKIALSSVFVFLLLIFAGVMQSGTNTDGESVSPLQVDDAWWNDLKQDLVSSFGSALQIGRPEQSAAGGDIFMAVSVEPSTLKTGEKAIMKLRLFTRFDTRFEGFVDLPVTANLTGEVSEITSADSEEITVLGRPYLSAVVYQAELTATGAGEQLISPGKPLMSVVVQEEQDNQAEVRENVEIIFPEVKVTVL